MEFQMQGLFVDNASCLCIVSQTSLDPPEWHVRRGNEDAEDPEGHDAVIETTTASHKWIRLLSDDKKTKGMFDGRNCIVWEDGDKWHRLRVSLDQMYFLRKRRYVPLTYVCACVLKTFAIQFMTQLHTVWASK